uniref:Cellulase n=1 Tax=Cyclophora tenuis TaxID=216820 RepID=A0A7S1GL85_CYCTE
MIYTVRADTSNPKYSVPASGGAAGSGSDVVSESQAYGLMITGLVLASWQTHSAVTDPNLNTVLTTFHGLFNGWRDMCENSSHSAGCQTGGTFCNGGSEICLPGWKHNGDLTTEVGTGSAPDGDEDAIVGMILALKAVDAMGLSVSWYNEVSEWAEASCTSFLYHNTVTQGNYRLVKLGSCWGGFDGNGQNPSYHSPGSYKLMRDFQSDFSSSDRSYSLPSGLSNLDDAWNKVIDTSYEALSVFQCPDYGLVPNWARIQIDSTTGDLEINPGSFTGSGTPQNEYGSEAARTTWRVALDAALYPGEVTMDAVPFMSPLLSKLEDGHTGSPNLYFSSTTLNSCNLDTAGMITIFGSWQYNAFIYGPTFSSLIVPSNNIAAATQQNMIDDAGTRLAADTSSSYYPRAWKLLSILMLNGAAEAAGIVAASGSPLTGAPVPVSSAPVTLSPVTSAPVASPATPAPVQATPAPVPPTGGNCQMCCSLSSTNGCPSWDNACFTEENCGVSPSCQWDSQQWVEECDDGSGCCAQNGVCVTGTDPCFEYGKCGIDDASQGIWCSWGGQLSWIAN